MTNATLTRTTAWGSRSFAVITLGPAVTASATPDYLTFGHDDPRCPRATGSVVAENESLTDYVERMEHFDGEFTLADPWPCATCVRIAERRHLDLTGPVPVERDYDYGHAPEGTRRNVVERDPRTDEAIEYARTYAGNLDFMLAMREKAQRRAWTPTPNILAAILRIKDAAAAARATSPAPGPEAAPSAPAAANPEDARRAALPTNRYPGSCASCRREVAAEAGVRERINGAWTVLHRTAAECAKAEEGGSSATGVRQTPAAAPLPDVPAGHYAIASTGDNDLAFYRVDRPTDGDYAGRTFVKLVVGGHPDQNVRRAAVPGILARIVEAGIKEAASLYGREIGRCCRCNRSLTDQTSRELGIGPECRSKGW